MQEENARRKALNEVAKTRIDLEVKDLKERGDTISKLMGEIHGFYVKLCLFLR